MKKMLSLAIGVLMLVAAFSLHETSGWALTTLVTGAIGFALMVTPLAMSYNATR